MFAPARITVISIISTRAITGMRMMSHITGVGAEQ
jgi:hypothetical protein